jgi:hypothetical protein
VGRPPIDERSRHDAKASPAFTVVSDRREKIILTGFLADCSAVCHAPLSSASFSDAASLFDIVEQMKGHVGGGSGSCGFKAQVDRLKLSCSYMSYTFPYVIDFVQSGSLR